MTRGNSIKEKKYERKKISLRSLASKIYLMIFKIQFSSLETVIIGNDLKFLNKCIIINLFKNNNTKNAYLIIFWTVLFIILFIILNMFRDILNIYFLYYKIFICFLQKNWGHEW